jgi:colicin import membrane protein
MRTRHLLAMFCLLAGAARAQDLNVISAVEVKDEGGSVVVLVKGTKPPNFTTFSMADPPRFVIDLSESKFQGVAESITVDDGVVSVVKNLSYGAGATSIARVMVAFVAEVEPPDVQTVGNDLVVRVAKPGGAAATPVAAEGAAREPQAAAAAAGTAAEAEAEAQARAQVEAEAQAQAQAQAQAEAEARAQAQVQAGAAEAAQQRARAEAEALAQAEAQARAEAEARARAAAAEPQAQEAAPAGEKLGEEGVVVAPPEQPAVSAAEARAQAAAQARAAAEAKAQAAAQARADAEAARAAERQAKADAKARAAEEARAKKQAEAEARAAALAEKKAAAEAAAAERKAKVAADAEARAAALAERKAAAEAARQAAAEARTASLAAAGPSARLAEIGFKQLPGASRVYVRTSVTPRFTVTDVGDDTVRVELENTRATRRNDTRFLDTSFFPSPVALITPSMKGSAYVVDIKLRQRVPYQQKVEGDVLAIDFERPSPAAAPAAAGEPLPADPGTLTMPAEGTVVAPAEPEAEPAPKQ